MLENIAQAIPDVAWVALVVVGVGVMAALWCKALYAWDALEALDRPLSADWTPEGEARLWGDVYGSHPGRDCTDAGCEKDHVLPYQERAS
jgi:hypothetical protein